MSQREYWSEAMEKRYKRRRLELWPKLPLKGQFVSKIFFCNFWQFLLLMNQKSCNTTSDAGTNFWLLITYLLSNQSFWYNSFCFFFKIHIFWEGHTIWNNLPLWKWKVTVLQKISLVFLTKLDKNWVAI